MNLAPTASTTAALALGDALAMALLVRKGFRIEDFANLHPGGKLGKRLLRAEQLMSTGEATPIVHLTTSMREVIYVMSKKALGMTCVVDDEQHLVGIITDGDLRRHMQTSAQILDQTAAEVMTSSPVTIDRHILAVEALKMLEERKITTLIVKGSDGRVDGVLHLHDLWRTELI
jgi:arabinose-5-phosphate isomerase